MAMINGKYMGISIAIGAAFGFAMSKSKNDQAEIIYPCASNQAS